MENREFTSLRQKLEKTQRQMSELLGTSLKAIQSFEQGWRKVPVSAERQLLLLLSLKKSSNKKSYQCWEVIQCPPEWRRNCAAWEFQTGHLCWFINGTFCQGQTHESWKKKNEICQQCKFFIMNVQE